LARGLQETPRNLHPKYPFFTSQLAYNPPTLNQEAAAMRKKRDTRDYMTRVYEREYDRIIHDQREWNRTHVPRRETPFIGGSHDVKKHDEIMVTVRKALAAQAWHERNAPSWACPLLLKENECDNYIYCSDYNSNKLLGYFSRSVRWNGWNIDRHPTFPVFCSGIMAYNFGPMEIRCDKELQQLFPPRKLEGLECSPLRWRPPQTSV
jgi:hypothetical protein